MGQDSSTWPLALGALFFVPFPDPEPPCKLFKRSLGLTLWGRVYMGIDRMAEDIRRSLKKMGDTNRRMSTPAPSRRSTSSSPARRGPRRGSAGASAMKRHQARQRVGRKRRAARR